MNINNLHEGQTIKNYKELCNIIGWKIATGNTKIAQLKDLERYCEYEKLGNKFIIKEVFKNPLPKIDNRGGNNKVYAEFIDKLILNMCAETIDVNKDSIGLSAKGMMTCLNIVNNNYTTGRNNMERFSNYLKIPIESLNDFYNSTYKNYKDSIESSLNRLENRCLISWNIRTQVYTIANTYREAQDIEIKEIKEIESNLLKEMGFESKQHVFMCGKWKEFNKLKKNQCVEKLGIYFDYKVYNIIMTNSFKEKVLETKVKNDLQYSLNNKVKEKALESAIKRHDKLINEYKPSETLKGKQHYFGTPFLDKDKNRISNNYIKDIEKIISLTIDKDCKIVLDKELLNVEDKAYTYYKSIMTDLQEREEQIYNIFSEDELRQLF